MVNSNNKPPATQYGPGMHEAVYARGEALLLQQRARHRYLRARRRGRLIQRVGPRDEIKGKMSIESKKLTSKNKVKQTLRR